MNFMEGKVWGVLIVFIFLIGTVSAADGWGEYTGEDVADSDIGDVEESDEDVIATLDGEDAGAGDPSFPDEGDSESNVDSDIQSGESVSGLGKSTIHTTNFYIAMGITAGVAILIALFLFFLLRPSKNRWKEPRNPNQSKKPINLGFIKIKRQF